MNTRRRKKRHLFRRTFGLLLAIAASGGLYLYVTEKNDTYPPVVAAVFTQDEIKKQAVERLVNKSSKNIPMIPLYAHRGFSENALENSFAAFDAALAAGCPQVELDVRSSSDGVLYVVHDDTLQSVAHNNSKVSDLTSEQLDAITMTNGEKVHRLSEVFQRYGTQLIYLVEFKENLEDVSAFTDLIYAQPRIAPNVQVQSFYAGTLEAIQKVFPNMFKQLLVENIQEFNQGMSLEWIDSLGISQAVLTEPMIQQVHEANKKVWVWTVDDSDGVRRFLNWGVDGVITNETAAVQVVKEQNSP